MTCHNMKFVIFVSSWITLSYNFCCASADPGKRDVAWARIISVEPSPPIQSWGFPSPSSPVTRGQFKNSILFRIHPDSPLNREAWIKSGFMSRESPPTKSFFSLLTPQIPAKVEFKGPKPKRPYSSPRRKVQLQNDTALSRRIPKLDESTNEFRLPGHNHHRMSGNDFASPGRSNIVFQPSIPFRGPLTPAPLPNTPIIFSPFQASPELQPSFPTIPPQQKYCYMQIPLTRPVVPLPLVHYLLPMHWNPQHLSSTSINQNEVNLDADSTNPVATITPTPLVAVNESSPAEDLVRSELINENSGSTTNVPNVTPGLEAVENTTSTTTASIKSLGIKSTQQSGNSPNPQIIDVEFREDAVPQMNTKHELSTTTSATTTSSNSSSNSNDGKANSETTSEETQNFNKLVVVPVEEAIPAEAEQRNPATESGESLLSSKENVPVSTRATIIEKTFRE